MDQLLDHLISFPTLMAYLIVFFVLLACGLGVPMPEDITLFVAGYYCYVADTNVWLMIALGFVGVLLGDSIIFMLGSRYGAHLLRFWFFRKVLPPHRLQWFEDKYKKWGNKIIFAARFMPGLRAPIYFSSGALKLPFRVFIFYDGLAALLSVPLIVYTVYFFGHAVDEVVGVIRKVEHGILLTIVTIALVLLAKWYLGRRKIAQGTQAL